MKKRAYNHRLKYERQVHNWSQQKVADMIGSTVINVSRWERGITSPSPYFRRQLCELYGKDAVALGFFPDKDNDVKTSLHPTIDKQCLYDPAIPLPFITTDELVGRDQLAECLRQQLRAGENLTLVALHGLPGVGKTALAIALASDPNVREKFCDGILWAGLGTRPNLPEIFSRWGALFGITGSDQGTLKSNEAWIRTLRKTIGTRRMLIVIDDVWEINDAIAMMAGGPCCTYLITTRFSHIAASCTTQKAISVPELSEEDGIVLLQRLAPEIMTHDAEKVQTLVRSVGALPLALTLMGRYLYVQGYRGRPHRFHAAMERLLDREQRLHLSAPIVLADAYPSLPSEAPLSLHSVIAVSDQHLGEQARQALRALSLFPAKPNTFSEEAALAVSAVSVEVLDMLNDAGLLEVDETGRYTIHRTIADYARASLTDREPFQRFVAYYQTYSEEHWTEPETLELESLNILAALEVAHTLEDQTADENGHLNCS